LERKPKTEEDLRHIHRANIEELKAMLRKEGETHKRILQKVRRESKKKFNARALFHPELTYLDELREDTMYLLT
jgi:hypothetical protein